MAVNFLARFAAQAIVPVYAAVGDRALEAVERLGLREGARFMWSPRQASLLLVSGELRDCDRRALKRLHDQLPHPRATLCWGAGDLRMPQAEYLASGEDPLPGIRELYRRLLTGERSSEDDLLPDRPPEPWEGRGDHGQGGEGMTGGVPYGRPMAKRSDDLRDGLQLDAGRVRLGPFLPGWPAGLILELTLQGDLLQKARVLHPPYPPAHASAAGERLRNIARLLFLLELVPQAEAVLRMACQPAGAMPAEVAGLRRRLRRWGVFAAIPSRLGRIDGNAARAMGLQCGEDGFSDVHSRLRQWLDEAEGEMEAGGGGRKKSRGPDGTGSAPPLAELLEGLEWHAARLVMASFDSATLHRLIFATSPQ